MKRTTTILATLIFLIISSCQKNNTDFNLGEEITIPFDKTATLDDNGTKMKFKFTELIEESRCPPKGTCIWAGRAIIELEVDGSEKFELGLPASTTPDSVYTPNSVDYMNYTVSLKAVTFKRDRHHNKENKYSIKIKVEK